MPYRYERNCTFYLEVPDEDDREVPLIISYNTAPAEPDVGIFGTQITDYEAKHADGSDLEPGLDEQVTHEWCLKQLADDVGSTDDDTLYYLNEDRDYDD